MALTWTELTSADPPNQHRRAPITHDAALGLTVAVIGTVGINASWVFDGADWSIDDPSQPAFAGVTSTSSGEGARMAFDPIREKVVFFGGRGYIDGGTTPILQNRTWERDSGGWDLISPGTIPDARDAHTMAWCAAISAVLMFGGVTDPGASTRNNETWAYDGDWTQLSPADSPDPWNSGVSCAFDDGVLLFGGQTGLLPNNDTWFFDGSDWTLLAPAHSPAARNNGGLVVDEASGWPILFGGSTVGGADNDTWAFIDGDWEELAPVDSPAARAEFGGLVYDTTLNAVLLNGGQLGGGGVTLSDDTWILEGLEPPPPEPASFGISHTFGRGN